MNKFRRLATLMYSNAIKDCYREYEEEAINNETYSSEGSELSEFELNLVNVLYDGVLNMFSEESEMLYINQFTEIKN